MNFYSIAGHEDGPDVFEKLLSSIEGEASRVFGHIADGTWPLEQEDRWTLAHFIALQAVRGPEQRRNMEHLAAQMARGCGALRSVLRRYTVSRSLGPACGALCSVAGTERAGSCLRTSRAPP